MTRILLSLTLLFSFAAQAKAAKRKPASWHPVSYEKFVLPKDIPEGVIFTKNEKPGQKPAYSATYFVDKKIFGTRALPKEMYLSLKQDLQKNVLAGAPKDLGGPCVDRVLWQTGKSKSSKVQTTPYCLGAQSAKRHASFVAWYRSIRNIFGFTKA
jgi:hypothetical protein